MAKDKIFLIAPGFTDPKREDGPFFCPFCNQIEGLLGSFPDLAKAVDVERVGFARPREKVIAAIGEANQGLPVLILGDSPPADAKSADGRYFVDDTKRILELLHERHGFPRSHG